MRIQTRPKTNPGNAHRLRLSSSGRVIDDHEAIQSTYRRGNSKCRRVHLQELGRGNLERRLSARIRRAVVRPAPRAGDRLSDIQKLPEITIEDLDIDFARGCFERLRVDLLLTRNPLFEQVRRQHATTGHFMERDVPCASVEGLLLLKVYALPSLYRQDNFARVGLYENDVATLVEAYRPSLEPLLSELSGYLGPTDLAVVREIVSEVQRRIERFRGESGRGE